MNFENTPQAPNANPHRATEHTDGQTVAEVVAMYGTTVIDAQHVGQARGRRRTAPKWLALGGLMMLGGGALFGHDAAQDWEGYQAAAVEAAQRGEALPERPGTGLGGFGAALALLGLIPLVVGGVRLRDRSSERYAIGEGEDADFAVVGEDLPDPAAFPMVTQDGNVFTVRFNHAMSGEVRMGDARRSLAELVERGQARLEGDHYAYPMPAGSKARVEVGENVFHIRPVPRGKAVATRHEVDRPFLAFTGGAAAVAVGMLTVLSMIPDAELAFNLDEATGESRFVGFNAMPDIAPRPERQEATEQGEKGEPGQGGQLAGEKGEEGKTGKTSSKRNNGKRKVGPGNPIPTGYRNMNPNAVAIDGSIVAQMNSMPSFFVSDAYSDHGGGPDETSIWASVNGDGDWHDNGPGTGVVGTGHHGPGDGSNVIAEGHTTYKVRPGCTGADCYNPGPTFDPPAPPKHRIFHKPKKIEGGLAKDAVRRVVRGRINEIRACYNQGLARNPHLSGRVATQFVISPQGKVSTMVVTGGDLKDPKVRKCITKTVKKWKFPKARTGQSTVVNYPFTFKAG